MSKKENEVISSTNPTLNFNRFQLIKGTKAPACRWSESKNWTKEPLEDNHAFITGLTNDIIVVDLDTYKWPTKPKHQFSVIFGDYVNRFDTFTVKTPRGGYHLYFKYSDDIPKSTANKTYDIDIRSGGGYIVAPGSKIGTKSYEIIRNTSIKDIPDDLRDYLIRHIYGKTDNDLKKEKRMREKHDKDVDSSVKPELDLSESDIDFILSKLPESYIKEHDNYLKFTTFCKIFNKKNLWEKYNVSKCSDCRDDNYYLDVKISDMNGIVSHILNVANMKEYYVSKKLPSNEIKPTKTFSSKKLGYEYFSKNKGNLVIQSDTGTGKTTSVKHELKRSGDKFLSITPRKSLGEEQYTIFSEFGINCKYYEYEYDLSNGDSVIIQLDSIRRIRSFDFRNYTIFLDEFNSLLEYLITSETLKDIRVEIFNLFINMIRSCKRLIGVDADISDICFMLLNSLNISYVFHRNTHQHSKGVNAIELTSRNELCDKLVALDKFLVPTDSRKEAEKLKNELNKRGIMDVVIITGDTLSRINLDKYNKIIFSPKVLYGLDSIIERPVLCIYTCNTIHSAAMVQQVNRCRNIENIYFYFSNKKNAMRKPKYANIAEVEDELKILEYGNILEFDDRAKPEERKIYLEMLARIKYNFDAYNSNKMAHFIRILKERGVIVHLNPSNPDKIEETKQDILEIRKENFDKNSNITKKINELLRIPQDQIENYIDFFIDERKRQNHFNISKFFFKNANECKKDVQNANDYKCNLVESNKNKLLVLREIFDAYNGNVCLETGKITIRDDGISETDKKMLIGKYLKSFRVERKSVEFKTVNDVLKIIVACMRNVFGNEFVDAEYIQMRENKKRIRKILFKISIDDYNNNYSLFKFRETKYDITKLDIRNT